MTPESPLRLVVAQPAIDPCGLSPADRHLAASVAVHGAVVEEAGDDDLATVVVFPELSLTGYCFDAADVSVDDPALAPLVEACGRTGCVALVGAPIREQGLRHIALLAIDGGGVSVAYRKVWLGADEVAHFDPGPGPVVITVSGWRLGLAICRDTGIDAHTEATLALGCDAYLAGVLEHDHDADVQPQRAQRIIAAGSKRGGVWVGVAGYAGSTGEGFDRAAGRSTIWRPDGSVAATVGPEPGLTATTILTPQTTGS